MVGGSHQGRGCTVEDKTIRNAGKPTPEQVVGAMSVVEIQELLGDLGMVSDVVSSQRFKHLVGELGCFELAIEALGGAATMRRAA